MTGKPRPLAEINANECRWPVNDASQGEHHLFCGVRAVESKPYCAEHQRLAYVPKGKGHD